jgi:DNA polymerase III subunit beta
MLLIQSERDTLLKPLQSVTGIVERRHTLPILSNVLIEGRDGEISFVATDLEIQITSTIQAVSEQPFALTVTAKKLQDIFRALPDNVPLSLEQDAARLLIRAGKSRFALQTLAADDFPRLAAQEDNRYTLKLSQELLKQLLHQVQYAMAQQDMRYYLNGLLLVIDPAEIKLVATDGHRLSYASARRTDLGLEADSGAQEIIVPRKTVLELVKLLADSDEEVTVQIGKNQITFAFGNIHLISKVVDGKFPDYTRVIPINYQKHLVIDRPTLLAAMQRAAILSNEKFRGIRMILGDNRLRVICNNTEQEEAEEELEVEYQGDPLDIGFNVNYLLDVLNNIDNQSVCLSFGDSNSSCLITLPGDDAFKYVVMPMRI